MNKKLITNIYESVDKKYSELDKEEFFIVTEVYSLDYLETVMAKPTWELDDILEMLIILVDNAFYFKNDIRLDYDVNKLVHAEIMIHELITDFGDSSIISKNKTFIEACEELEKVRNQILK